MPTGNPQPVIPSMMKSISVVVTVNGKEDTAYNEYADAVSSFQFVPSQTVSTWRGGTPDSTWSDVTPPTWTLVMKLAQDWHTGNSFVNYLLAKSGTVQHIVFKPATDHLSSFEADIAIAVPAIGGDIDAWLEAGVTCAVHGTPFLGTAG